MIVMTTSRTCWQRGLALVAAAPLLVGCGVGTGSASGGSERPRVVASFYPLEYVAERIAGDHAEVSALTSPGAEPHDLELTLEQIAALEEADVVVFSRGFQPAVDEAVGQVGTEDVVDAADVADLVPPDEDSAAHEDGEEAHDHGDEAVDPHFWLDPTRLATVAAAVEERLAVVDPAHADDYATNLADLQGDLEDLDTDAERGLAQCARDTVVVSHDAFGYYTDRYGLELEAINGLSPDAEPSPAHLRELSDLIEEKGITTVFSERLATAELADTLAGDLGLETDVLDPIEGLSDETADEDYLSLMRVNLAAIQEANDCR